VTELPFLHSVRNAGGVPLAALRYASKGGSFTRFEFLNATGALFLAVHVGGPEATRIVDSAGRDIPAAAGCHELLPADPAMRTIGSSTVMMSCEVNGYPAWIIDDYENRVRHFIIGCTPDLFLHVNLDDRGTVTLTEKTHEHATLRSVRRDATGTLLADEATVQTGEHVDDVARRCGVSSAHLLTANPGLGNGAPTAGEVVRLA
jgi:hypothetical protein